MSEQVSLPPPLPTGPAWTSSESRVVHADRAEKRLKNALRELKRRGDRVADGVRAAGPPVRMLAIAVGVGLGAVFLFAALRWATRPPRLRAPRRRPSLAAVVGRSVAGELAMRAALGAAGVIGAKIAHDVLAPAMTKALSAHTREVADDADEEDDDDDEE